MHVLFKRSKLIAFRSCIFFFFLLTAIATSAQQRKPKQEPKPLTKDQVKGVKQDANALFAFGSYELAIRPYLDLYKADPKNVDVNFRLGYCYLMTDVNRAEAVKYLEY